MIEHPWANDGQNDIVVLRLKSTGKEVKVENTRVELFTRLGDELTVGVSKKSGRIEKIDLPRLGKGKSVVLRGNFLSTIAVFFFGLIAVLSAIVGSMYADGALRGAANKNLTRLATPAAVLSFVLFAAVAYYSITMAAG